MGYKRSKKDIIENIKKNYIHFETSIVNELLMRNDLHGTTTGSAREDTWKRLFEAIIPKKFVIEQSVFIIDSKYIDDDSDTGISREVDLAIIDESYTPYIFRFGKIKFVPIEAVAVVVECKSTKPDTKTLQNWLDAIGKLQTSDRGITRTISAITCSKDDSKENNQYKTTITETKPIKIYCGIDKPAEELQGETEFDFIISVNKEDKENKKDKKLDIQLTDSKNGSLKDWLYKLTSPEEKDKEKLIVPDFKLNEHYVVGEGENKNTLLTFNFQLNQLLMLLNNPLFFPHLSYVEMFNEGKTIEPQHKEG